MKLARFSNPKALAATALALAALGTAGVAQARSDVVWSIGAQVAPGVTIGMGNARPVVYGPAPVYYAPQPVYYGPSPVYVAPAPVYYVRPAPVVYGPPVVYGRGYKHNKWRGKHRHWNHD